MPEIKAWMAALPDTALLSQITLPATHDSGMSNADHGFLLNPLMWVTKGVTSVAATVDTVVSSDKKLKLTHDNFTTQLYDVYGQLLCGARQFDLRLTTNYMKLVCYHGHWAQSIVGMRRYGEEWAHVCSGIAHFIKAHPTEFVILKMDKETSGITGDAKDAMKALNKALTDQNYIPRLHGSLTKKYVDQETIRTLRGRILVCGKKSAIKGWTSLSGLNPAISICEWQKDETGAHPVGPGLAGALKSAAPNGVPIYLLLGGADGNMTDTANVLQKQASMKTMYQTLGAKTVGMRGIWFNTFSYLRDIRTYSEKIWEAGNKDLRNNLWLAGAARQNVASVDFLDKKKAEYIIRKNQFPGFDGVHGDGYVTWL